VLNVLKYGLLAVVFCGFGAFVYSVMLRNTEFKNEARELGLQKEATITYKGKSKSKGKTGVSINYYMNADLILHGDEKSVHFKVGKRTFLNKSVGDTITGRFYKERFIPDKHQG